MFRIISSNSLSTIKTKVGTNVGQAASRNGLNVSSRRLNTSHFHGIEQDTNLFVTPHHFPTSYNATTSANGNNTLGKLKINENRRNAINCLSDVPYGEDNPLYSKLLAFEECVNITYNSNNKGKNGKNNHGGNRYLNNKSQDSSDKTFWYSIQNAMKLYNELSGTPEFNSERVAKLIYLLHTGLRQSRYQTLKLDKKPDFDSRNSHVDTMTFICSSLRQISSDIISNKNSVNEYGAMHLITSFKELKLSTEAISVWENCRLSYSSKIFLDPRVVGVILPLMYENGHSFESIEKLFKLSKSQINYYHPNLAVGMIRVCLLANEVDMALNLFDELRVISNSKNFGYLTETHLSFIGESADLSVANLFFEKALKNEMPYKVELQVPYIKKYMNHTWSQTKDFDQVLYIWMKCWANYGNKVNKGVSSSLNELFLSIFFENYQNNKVEGFQKLQNIIQIYANIKPVDEPFLNIIMTKCIAWQDTGIISEISSYYDYYNVNKTQVAYRVSLKALGSIYVSNFEILKKWDELVLFSDFQGSTFIHNADWAALRDATIGSMFGDRVELFAKIVKAYSKYCKSMDQVINLIESNSNKYPYVADYMRNLYAVNTDDIIVPNFENIQEFSMNTGEKYF